MSDKEQQVPPGLWGWCGLCLSLELAQLWEGGTSLSSVPDIPLRRGSLRTEKER